MVWNGGVNRVSEGETRAVWSSLNNRTEQSRLKAKGTPEMRDGVQ